MSAFMSRSGYFPAVLALVLLSCRKVETKLPPAAVATSLSLQLTASEIILVNTAAQKEHDSFFSLPPLRFFTGDASQPPWLQLMAEFIDTSSVIRSREKFAEDVQYRYDKENSPVWRNMIVRHPDFSVEIIDTAYNSAETKSLQIRINGKQQRFGKEMDTSLCWDALVYSFYPDAENCRVLKAGSKRFLYLRGIVDKCNGMACGVSFHIIYDPVSNRSVAFHQFRYEDLHVAYDPSTHDLIFCCIRDQQYDEFKGIMPFEGEFYRFTSNGKLLPLKNKKGEQLRFYAYQRLGDFYGNGKNDTLVLLEGRPPAPRWGNLGG